MVFGITMIKVVPGHEKATYDALRETDGVKEIYHLFGEYDFFLILKAPDRTGLGLLLKEIRIKRSILDTWSLLVSKESSSAVPAGGGIAFQQVGELAAS